MISYLCHPILLPVYLLLFLLTSDKYELVAVPFILKLSLAGLTLLTTLLLPLSFIWLLLKLRYINSLYLDTKEERPYPLITMAIFYYATYYIIREVPVSPVFNIFILGASLIAGVTSVISIFRKISLHMTGIGSITGLFLGLALHHGLPLLPEIIMMIILSGIIGWARLRCGAHPPNEIYTGFLAGLLFMGTLMLLV
jgi:membrane-associated phospholipid phosphatase